MIEATDIHLRLGRGASAVDVLRGASLFVPRGSSAAVIGPSGSGKSSLLMVLAGLERPQAGTVTVDGIVMTGLSERERTAFRGRTIGIVFQSFHLIPTMTALENVSVPLELAGIEGARTQANAALERVGLGQRAGHYPLELSGGEQQRVAIARALAPRPKVILADEPTGNLDETTGGAIIDLIFAVADEAAQTVVLVTHDSVLAARCDQRVEMHNGQTRADPALAPVS